MMFLDENIRNIDSSDSDEEMFSRRISIPMSGLAASTQSSTSTGTNISQKVKKKKNKFLPSLKNPVIKKGLWILLAGIFFIFLCGASALFIKKEPPPKRWDTTDSIATSTTNPSSL